MKRNTPCAHLAALRDRGSRCPRGDEYAVIWDAAKLEPAGDCRGKRTDVATEVADYAARGGVMSAEPMLPRGVGGAAYAHDVSGARPS